MNILDKIRPTKRNLPARILVYGEHKIGKSTFASQAEGAVFVPTEDGQDNVEANAFPLCQTWDAVLECVAGLYQQEHEYKTVVVDSIDWAEKLAQKKVSEDAGVSSIEKIGYAKGYAFAADLMRELLDGLNALRIEKNMQVILVAHSEIRRFDDPMADSYDRYQIKMHKHVAKLVQEWSDIIAFAQLDTITSSKDEGFSKERVRAYDTGRRVLRLAPGAAYDAGSRYDLPPTIPLVWSEFETELNKSRSAEADNKGE